jgi:hypothetical protein
MQYEVIALTVSSVLILLVLIRISLTLNEIGTSLRKLARRKNDANRTAPATILHEASDLDTPETAEAEVAAAIALARASLDESRTLK